MKVAPMTMKIIPLISSLRLSFKYNLAIITFGIKDMAPKGAKTIRGNEANCITVPIIFDVKNIINPTSHLLHLL